MESGKRVLRENAQQRTEVDKPAPKRSRYENAERDVTPQESTRKPADRGLNELDEVRGCAGVTQGTTSGSIIMSSPGGFHATWWTKGATALPCSVHAPVSEMGNRGYCITNIGKELEGTSVVIVNDSVNTNVTTGEGATDRDVAMTRERKRHREDECAVKVGDRTRVKYGAEEIDEPSPKRSTRDAHDPSQEKPEDTSAYCCVEDARRCRSTDMLRDAKRAFLQALIDKVRGMKLPEDVIADVEKSTTDATLSMGLSVFGESRTPYGAVMGFLVSIGAEVTEKLQGLPSFVSLAKAQQAALYKALKDAIVCVADTLFASAPSQPNAA